jgi:hypothetical protein
MSIVSPLVHTTGSALTGASIRGREHVEDLSFPSLSAVQHCETVCKDGLPVESAEIFGVGMAAVQSNKPPVQWQARRGTPLLIQSSTQR